MKGKCVLFFGFAAGYVLGAKAGRQRYIQIKNLANKVWRSKRVQGTVQQVEDFAYTYAPEVTEKVQQGARFVVNAVTGRGSESEDIDPPKPKPRTSSADGSARKASAKKSATD